jgi:dual specificity phosphatase 12
MRPSLFPDSADKTTIATASTDDAPLSGRLTCPNTKCEANIGKFAWQGFQCSCGKWVVPAIGVARARVDVTDQPAAAIKTVADASSNNTTTTSSSKLGAMGIRLPPHMRAAAIPDPHRNNL